MEGAPRALPPTSAFAADTGAADPALAAVLDRHAAGHADLPDVVGVLAGLRVLVPVLAELEEQGVTEAGLHVDKEASAGVVALRVPDGRTALPVFTGVEAMAAWRADARPVPTAAPRAAAAALAEGWELLVLDPAGPVTVVLPHPAVRALATGGPWVPAVSHGAVRPEVRAAVRTALAGTPRLADVDAVPGTRAEVAVVLSVDAGLDRPALDGLLSGVSAALAASDVVTGEVDSLELRVRTAASPGSR